MAYIVGVICSLGFSRLDLSGCLKDALHTYLSNVSLLSQLLATFLCFNVMFLLWMFLAVTGLSSGCKLYVLAWRYHSPHKVTLLILHVKGYVDAAIIQLANYGYLACILSCIVDTYLQGMCISF